jgi:hypothetical protein
MISLEATVLVGLSYQLKFPEVGVQHLTLKPSILESLHQSCAECCTAVSKFVKGEINDVCSINPQRIFCTFAP